MAMTAGDADADAPVIADASFFAWTVSRTAASPEGIANSATRRGGSSPANTKERTSPFCNTWRALIGGGVPMAVNGM